MLSGRLIREARKRAGLTQAELGARLAKGQSEIGRWERGEVQPSLETLRAVIAACGLELTVGLANADDSYGPHIERMLALSPGTRVRRAAGAAEAGRRLRGGAGR